MLVDQYLLPIVLLFQTLCLIYMFFQVNLRLTFFSVPPEILLTPSLISPPIPSTHAYFHLSGSILSDLCCAFLAPIPYSYNAPITLCCIVTVSLFICLPSPQTSNFHLPMLLPLVGDYS